MLRKFIDDFNFINTKVYVGIWWCWRGTHGSARNLQPISIFKFDVVILHCNLHGYNDGINQSWRISMMVDKRWYNFKQMVCINVGIH